MDRGVQQAPPWGPKESGKTEQEQPPGSSLLFSSRSVGRAERSQSLIMWPF